MISPNLTSTIEQTFDFFYDSTEYVIDAWQRSFLFTDILRKRGNNYLDHIQKGQPPVLIFEFEMVMDGRTFDRPVNYALVKILDRREDRIETSSIAKGGSNTQSRPKKLPETGDRRLRKVVEITPLQKRPIVVIDPRAGHGPGIGGSKLNSQIGVALDVGHPVYFMTFYTEPEPGQTLADIQDAEVRFLEEIVRRHPKTDKPAVIGNCQAGWAAALIGADRPDIIGPMVFNGSPLSYWGGVEGANPMRYRGGLCGGVWLTDLLCDLGNGRFDGANLVAGFEDLNPANTLWKKMYNVYANVDTEEERYLNFAKWWGGFFKMNQEEIHFIVDSLFVGNELEYGFLELQKGKTINLKNLKDPIVVFASSGDNITPPQQALNWIVKVYGTTDEIKRCGQVIVYIIHEKIGHLGIFVAGSVAEREHKEIINSVEMLEYLAPGLYEMVIRDDPSQPWLNDHDVSFEEREIQDILKLDDGLEDEEAFRGVSALSRFNDKIYQTFFSPWVRALSNEFSAEFIRQLHPLRMQRYLYCDLNPYLWPIKMSIPFIKQYRFPVSKSNMLLNTEQTTSSLLETLLNYYRDRRDSLQEHAFKSLYGNPWMQTLFSDPSRPNCLPTDISLANEDDNLIQKKLWSNAMKTGGFKEAVTRIILAIMRSNHVFDKRQFDVARKIIGVNARLKNIHPNDLKILVKQQAALLRKDESMALKTLISLLPKKADRMEAFEIANSIATADMELDDAETEVLNMIKKSLKLK